jgi:hypothetical protein
VGDDTGGGVLALPGIAAGLPTICTER